MEFAVRTGRKHYHVLGQFECSGPSDHLLLTRFALQAPMSLLNRAVSLSYCTVDQSSLESSELNGRDLVSITSGLSYAVVRCFHRFALALSKFALLAGFQDRYRDGRP